MASVISIDCCDSYAKLIKFFTNISNTSWFSLSMHNNLCSFSGALVPNYCVKSLLKTLGSIGIPSSSSLVGDLSASLSLLKDSDFLSFFDLLKSAGL